MDTYNKNGSHLERRKLYYQLPFNHMYSQLPLDWNNPTQNDYKPLRERDRPQIEKVYNGMVERQMSMRRYGRGGGGSGEGENEKSEEKNARSEEKEEKRVGVNGEERYREHQREEALSRQVQKMNSSRVAHGPNPELNRSADYPLDHNHSMHLPDPDHLSPKMERYGSASQIPLLPRPPMPIPRRLPNAFRHSPQLIDKDSMAYPFRNAMPDRLESFLRDQAKLNPTTIMNTYVNNTRRERSERGK